MNAAKGMIKQEGERCAPEEQTERKRERAKLEKLLRSKNLDTIR